MGNYLWGDMNRATNDPTLIDEAIGTAITAHNDDPDAHLGDDQSLQSHRASEIIDHLAQSVVNDKLADVARAYRAVVDASSDQDYDSIVDGVNYASDSGGGLVSVSAGTYNIDSNIEWGANVGLVGSGNLETVIAGEIGSGSVISIPITTGARGTGFSVDNAVLMLDDDLSFSMTGGSVATQKAIYFTNCVIIMNGGDLDFGNNIPIFNNCIIQCVDGCVAKSNIGARFYNCDIEYDDGHSICSLWQRSSGSLASYDLVVDNCHAYVIDGSNGLILFGSPAEHPFVTNNYFDGLCSSSQPCNSMSFIGNFVYCKGDSYFLANGEYSRYIGNMFTEGTGNNFRFASGDNYNIALGNHVSGGITNSGTGNSVANNVTI